jgi:tetratricopeptide (TPR) repeat protein
LLTLRDSAPEDSDVNLELARLAAGRHAVTEALRFYHNALYAPWPPELAGVRRRVRLELIRFLLDHHQSDRALAELLAVSTDLPDEPGARLEVAALFARAGDDDHALEQFQRTLRLDPENAVALTGVGRSAFQLGKYALARTYLRRAPSELDDVGTMREVTDLVLSRDPLANRIGSMERRRRLTSDLTYARERLAACPMADVRTGANGDESALQEEAGQFEDQLRRSRLLEQDTIEAGVDLVYRLARRIAQACAPPTAIDRALLLIGREHGGEAR